MAEESRIELERYKLNASGLVVDVRLYLDNNGIGHYDISVLNVSKATNLVLKKIREEFISKMNVGFFGEKSKATEEKIRRLFEKEIIFLIHKYFPNAESKTQKLLVTYLIKQNVGMADIEILLKDEGLEEIVINAATEPVRVYHKKHGWLETNIKIENEKKIRHYATMIGRDVGKEITLLKPLMDAHLKTGDRVNATLMPISSGGNTITIRKFAAKPWTITDLIELGTINYDGAALVWLAIEYEMSVIVAGGSGSGKTSMLNVVSNFFPPNQRIISIEDTRELTLPKGIHWVPMETRLPNPEGKGGVTMLDCIVNSLRMRPDRILMGEIRRKAEAQVLFEAMHTGHSVYGTFHANTVKETFDRLTNPPIDIPKMSLCSVGLIVVQYRNRKNMRRRTFQIAEIDDNANFNTIMQYDPNKDNLEKAAPIKSIYERIGMMAGLSKKQIDEEIEDKKRILKWISSKGYNDVNKIGTILSKYYARKIINAFRKKDS